MPLSDNDLRDVQGRVMRMFMDTIATFEMIEKNAEAIYGDRSSDVRAAINEYFNDFLRNTRASGEKHPETLIYETPRQNFQRAGLYGAQLKSKNARYRERMPPCVNAWPGEFADCGTSRSKNGWTSLTIFWAAWHLPPD